MSGPLAKGAAISVAGDGGEADGRPRDGGVANGVKSCGVAGDVIGTGASGDGVAANSLAEWFESAHATEPGGDSNDPKPGTGRSARTPGGTSLSVSRQGEAGLTSEAEDAALGDGARARHSSLEAEETLLPSSLQRESESTETLLALKWTGATAMLAHTSQTCPESHA